MQVLHLLRSAPVLVDTRPPGRTPLTSADVFAGWCRATTGQRAEPSSAVAANS
jgi:hypothetical protein